MDSDSIGELDARDTFWFKQLAKVKVSLPVSSSNERCSLLCVSNDFGLTFVGCNQGVKVFNTTALCSAGKDQDHSNTKATFVTPAVPLDISLSCDSLTLSVCFKEGGTLKCLLFDVRGLAGKNAAKSPFCGITLSTGSNVGLNCLQWNPSTEFSDLLVVCLSDGTLHMLSVKDEAALMTSSPAFHAISVCWSPKGKQVVVCSKEHIMQVTKKLEVKKSYPLPDIYKSSGMVVSDVFWVSTYLFALVLTKDKMTSISVFFSTSKEGTCKYISAEDLHCESGAKLCKFHFSYLQKWGVLVSSSSNGPDTAVFSDAEDQWRVCELEDTGRAAFPLEASTDEETFASGMALDLTSQQPVVLNDMVTLPPCPVLLLLSDRGILSPFTVIKPHSKDCLKEMISPPKPLPSSSARQSRGHAPQPSTAAPVSSSGAVTMGTTPAAGGLSLGSTLGGSGHSGSSGIASNAIDGEFSSQIQQMAEGFWEEISELKKAMSDVYGDWDSGESKAVIKGLGNVDDLQHIQEEIVEVEEKVGKTNLQQKCELLEEDTLKCLEIHEQTKGELRKRSDRNYISLQRLRPLDSCSLEKLSNMRSRFLQVRQSLQGVTSQLEGRLQSIYEERRQKGRDPLKVPTLHIVYSTLKDHHRISRLQNVEVEKLVRSMKDLKLIPHCWQSSDFPDHSSSPRTSPGRPIGRRGLDASPSPSRSVGRRSLDTPTSELGGGAVKKRKSPSSEKVTHQQVMKLREYFTCPETPPPTLHALG